MSMQEKMLTAEEIAARWRMSEQTLALWRKLGKGPKYIKLGNARSSTILYKLKDILQYEETMTVDTKSE